MINKHIYIYIYIYILMYYIRPPLLQDPPMTNIVLRAFSGRLDC